MNDSTSLTKDHLAFQKSRNAMQEFTTLSSLRQTMFIVGLVVALGLTGPMTATAQEPDQNLSSQLLKLQEQVARLEAALSQNSNRTPSDTPAEGGQAGTQQAGTQDTTGGGVPSGFRIRADYQNCLQCHQTRPTNPLPQSHLEKMTTSAPAGQAESGAASGADQGTQTKSDGMGGGMGEGKMGGGMGGGMGKGMMGQGMGGGMSKGMMGGGMGDGSAGMGGGQEAMGASTAGTMEQQMQQQMQQMQQMQQQMQQQMLQMMQMQMLQMKLMEMQLKMMDRME